MSLPTIPASASTLFRYCTFDQISILERQTSGVQKSFCIASLRLRGTVNEPLTFKRRVPTLMIALHYRPWYFALRLALCISITFCGWFVGKLNYPTVVFVQTYDGFCCEQLHLVRSLQNVGPSLANWLKKDFDYHNYDRENFINRSLKGVKNLF